MNDCKDYYDIVAEQSNVDNLNIDIPEDLFRNLVSYTDPGSLKELPFVGINWNVLEQFIRDKNRLDSVNLDAFILGPVNDQRRRLIVEVLETCQNIRKYSDANILNSIDKDSVQRISYIMVIILSYMPTLFDIQDIVNSFMFPNGPEVIANVMWKMPELRESIINAILFKVQSGRNKHRMHLISMIIDHVPRYKIITKLASIRGDCNYACKLALEKLTDNEFIEFVEPFLCDKQSLVYKTLLRHGSKSTVLNLFNKIVALMKTRTTFYQRLVFCAIELSYFIDNISEEDIVTMTRYIFDGDVEDTISLSALVAVPFFTQYPVNQTTAVQPPHKCVDEWLQRAKNRFFENEDSPFASNLLYIHSCIISGKFHQLSEFVSETLKRKIELSDLHTQVLKNAFLSKCLNEYDVAVRSANQSVTKRFSELSSGRLSIHSIFALQTAGLYKKHKINISNWLELQLRNVCTPASAVLAELMEVYASHVVETKSAGLSLQFLKETVDDDILNWEHLPRRLYVLLYLCSYREQLQKVDTALKSMIYPEEIYTKLPVRYWLSAMESRHTQFESIRSRVLARCANSYPYLLPTAKSILLMKNYNDKLKIRRNVETAESNLEKLRLIEECSLDEQLKKLPVYLQCFMDTLKEGEEDDILIRVFDRYEQLCPRLLYEKSAEIWTKDDEDLKVDDFYNIPALLFRCDTRILSSPMHFECFVRTLHFFSEAVRWDLRLKMTMTNLKYSYSGQSKTDERKEKELLTFAYTDSQHSVLVHALIEVCDEVRMKDDLSDFGLAERRSRIRRIAYNYIHRVFIDHDGLLKVVLTQQFPIRQIASMVDGIPSLFAANSLILELLVPADIQRRVFAIALSAELSRKYRVRECLETARAVCNFVSTLHKFGQLPATYRLWKHIVPALVTISTQFPSMTDSVTRLLQRVEASTKNRIAVRFGLLSSDPKHSEHKLVELIEAALDRSYKACP